MQHNLSATPCQLGLTGIDHGYPGNTRIARTDQSAMTAPAEIQPVIDSALSRVASELEAIAEALERLETLVALIASAATAK